MRNEPILVSKKEATISGSISAVYFSSPNWSSGRIISTSTENGKTSYNEIPFAGSLCAILGEDVRLVGTWSKHIKFGLQFKVISMFIDIPISTEGIAKFLEKNPEMKGIGTVRANKIANEFGADFSEALENHPEQIAKIAGVPLKNILALKYVWDSNKNTNSVMMALSAYSVSHNQSKTLVAKYGDATLR
ncbi:hypothetical protein GOV10_04180, partial [Candidatus Woesearchaeota archaeon]|nr:hypothetical protein [Candidatus Woesearchaeota archaeon]